MNKMDKVQALGNRITRTHEGGLAYANTLKEDLQEVFTLGLLNGNFYTSQEEVLINCRNLFEKALKVSPEYATKGAIYGSTEANSKLTPTIWAVYVSTLADKRIFKSAFPRIIRNFNMLYDFMEICRKGGIRMGLGRGIKKAINDRFISMLNEYHATRSKNMLSEIAKATRPNCNEEGFQKLMKYISYGELTLPRAIALKTVIASLEEGTYSVAMDMLVRENNMQLEELKHALKGLTTKGKERLKELNKIKGTPFISDKELEELTILEEKQSHTLYTEDKKRLYATIYSKLNYSALILNLVALERVYATKSNFIEEYNRNRCAYIVQEKVIETDIPDDVLEMVADRIVDEKAYRRSHMLPFALINAERMVVTPEFKNAIGKLLKVVAQNAFNIDINKKILLGVDTSGSMGNQVVPGLTNVQIASLFGSMVKKAHTNTKVCAVATYCGEVAVTKQDDVFNMAEKIKNTNVGHGTEFEELMGEYNGEDFVILITDNEPADNLEASWLSSKRRPNGSKLIIWQISLSGHKISKDKSVVYIQGYSDKLIGLIQNIIEGKSNQTELIEAISL